ncbi:DUF4760 domain-containing protein [Sulfitobacter sp.]|jgi:hypothetical protein|uniref:DUF4760 domain-containing protein n=1 Tax=Sulfitobacter sp. TaxID=1903071 RepID=UPI0039E2DF3F
MIARTFLFLLGALFACTLCIFLLMLMPLASASLSSFFAIFPNEPNPLLSATGTVIAAILVFRYSARAANLVRRRRNTTTVLMEMQQSPEFLDIIEKRRAHFPDSTDVSFDDWNRARKAIPPPGAASAIIKEHKAKRDSALALTTLLNHYESLAAGITEGDLEERMLKKALRSIMCNLVDDSRHMIAGMQRMNPNNYAHLTALYGQWRKHNACDINGDPNERPIPRES